MENDQVGTSVSGSGKQELSERQQLLLAKRLRGVTGKPTVEHVEVRPPGSAVLLSAEQRRVWLHASQHPDSAIYNEPITIQKIGSFNLQILNASLDEVVRRHESWRTSFNDEGKGTVHTPFHVPHSIHRRKQPHGRRSGRGGAPPLLPPRHRNHSDYSAIPLFRARVVRVSETDHRLYLTLHHIIFDGVSLATILLPELVAIYQAYEQGKPSPLPEPKIQYADYSLWRERQLALPQVQTHLEYWLRQLGGDLPILRLPSDRPRPAMPTNRGSMEKFRISEHTTTQLRAFSRTQGVTMYMVLLAAYKVLLFRYSGQDDLIVGTALDARRHPDLKDVMGYFLDTVAIRTKPSDELPFFAYLLQTRDAVLDAFTASEVPFDRVVHELRPKRDSSHHPVFQAFFSMRPLMGEPAQGWKLNHLDIAVEAAKFDLYFEFGEQVEDIEGRILYSTDLFEAASIKRMQEHFLILLKSICDDPEKSLSQLSILSAQERKTLLGIDGLERNEQCVSAAYSAGTVCRTSAQKSNSDRPCLARHAGKLRRVRFTVDCHRSFLAPNACGSWGHRSDRFGTLHRFVSLTPCRTKTWRCLSATRYLDVAGAFRAMHRSCKAFCCADPKFSATSTWGHSCSQVACGRCAKHLI